MEAERKSKKTQGCISTATDMENSQLLQKKKKRKKKPSPPSRIKKKRNNKKTRKYLQLGLKKYSFSY